MKKLKIFLLTLLMVITILPINTLAEGEQTTAPDVTVYATKEQMMDGTFAPKSDGTADIKARIQFGKDDIGRDYQWFILKADQGVEGDNTVIFSMDFLADKRLFNSSSEAKIIYDYTKDDITVYSEIDSDNDGKVTVSGNHYGASNLRKDLIAMSSNENMFSPAEQELMNATPIKTYDTNNDLDYITNDKLYAMSSGGLYSNKVKLGSSNKLTISTRTYVSYYPTFHGWLRTPDNGHAPTDGGDVYYLECLGTAQTVQYKSTIDPGIMVIPASNLNLTDVLFASAAKAGSTEIIQSDAVMTLRLNGADKNIGEVYYDEENKEIIVSKGSTENKVHLILQGKDSRNWYYSKEITGKEVIKASDIENAIGLTPELILANSKIWIEITDTDGMKYAVEAKAVQEINSVEVKIDAPEAGKDLATDVLDITEGINVDSITWETSDTTAGYNETYTASIKLSAASGYKFANSVTPTLNNEVLSSVSKNTDGTLTVTYKFDHTAKDEFVKAYDPDPITVENGTSLEAIKALMPTTVKVDTKGQGKIDKPVSWNPYADIYTSYDPTKKDAQSFTIDGGVNLGNSISYSNDGPPQVKLSIFVKAAEVVPTPTPVPPSSSNNNPITGNTTADGYVVPNTGVK